MKKGIITKILLILGLVLTLWSFYTINHKNYLHQKSIDAVIVKHPENLPRSEVAKLQSFGFMNISANIYWIKAIQYIGANVIQEDYKKYLGAMMDLITDLNPYFESPYIIGQLLLPGDKYNLDEQSTQQGKSNLKKAEILGLKGVDNFCDTIKIQAIIDEDNLGEILTNSKYRNPCQSYKIPYYLAFIYYFHNNDGINSANYYKVVSAQDDAPSGAKILAAIMQGKGGEREKSLYMFLSLSQSTGSQGEACTYMSNQLQEVYTGLKDNSLPLKGELIKQIEEFGNQVLPELTEGNEAEVLDDTKCTNYLAKAMREINLMYIEAADKQYVLDNPSEISAGTPQVLFEQGYIDFIPTDYQQYTDKGYGIIYKYNEDNKGFDYEMDYSDYGEN